MKMLLALATLLGLSACGADGEPTPPVAKTGVAVSGEVLIGAKG